MQASKIIAIIGSRTSNKDDHFRAGRLVWLVFQNLNKDTDLVVSGGAGSGADWWAKRYCKQYKYMYLEATAFWDEYGKSAGMFRNRTIATVCTHCVAVWDGKSRGTEQTMKFVQDLGKPLWVLQL